MMTLKRFWLALESLAGQGAVRDEWQMFLGPEFPVASGQLQMTGRIAASYPRSHPLARRAGLPRYRVIPFRDSVFLGVLPEGGEAIRLMPEEVAVYQLRHDRMLRRLAELVGCPPAPEPLSGLPNAFAIGTLAPTAGYRFPIFVAFSGDRDAVRRIVDGIAAQTRAPFLLCLPSLRFRHRAVDEVLTRCGARLLPLCDCLAITDCGQWQWSEIGRGILAEFLDVHLPRRDTSAPSEFFPTPARAHWGDVGMRFRDGETVSIDVGDVRGVFNYTQMGMASGKDGRPTRQWDLLRVFAEAHGRLDWDNRQAHRRHKKQKQLLAQRLRAFFRIDGDPFMTAGTGWQTRFSIESDR